MNQSADRIIDQPFCRLTSGFARDLGGKYRKGAGVDDACFGEATRHAIRVFDHFVDGECFVAKHPQKRFVYGRNKTSAVNAMRHHQRCHLLQLKQCRQQRAIQTRLDLVERFRWQLNVDADHCRFGRRQCPHGFAEMFVPHRQRLFENVFRRLVHANQYRLNRRFTGMESTQQLHLHIK